MLQPLDTHGFAIWKEHMRRAHALALASSARGEVHKPEFVGLLFQVVRRCMQGRRWADAFDRDGFSLQQEHAGAASSIGYSWGVWPRTSCSRIRFRYSQRGMCSTSSWSRFRLELNRPQKALLRDPATGYSGPHNRHRRVAGHVGVGPTDRSGG